MENGSLTQIIVAIITTTGAIVGPVLTVVVTRRLDKKERRKLATTSQPQTAAKAEARNAAQGKREKPIPTGDVPDATLGGEEGPEVDDAAEAALARWRLAQHMKWWQPFIVPLLAAILGAGAGFAETTIDYENLQHDRLSQILWMIQTVLYYFIIAASFWRAWSHGRNFAPGGFLTMHLESVGIWSAYVALRTIAITIGSGISQLTTLSWAVSAWIIVAIASSMFFLRARRAIREIVQETLATA
jgi:hypothetical protein